MSLEAALKIRAATLSDVPAMIAVERHAVSAAHWRQEDYERLFSSAGPKRLALLIEDQAGVQGFLVARVVQRTREIENLAVARPARRRGLGTRLLGEFLDRVRAEGAESVFLEVRESNRAARMLYEKWGFLESSRRPNYYHNPEEDAVTYELSFA